MKKTVKIDMYLDCTTEWGDRRWNYVCTVWGDHIEFDNTRWYLRDAENRLVSWGNLSELHGAGSYDFGVQFMNVVCY